jgi:4-alpha-glucanotransferase
VNLTRRAVFDRRRTGLLLHPTSLPGTHGALGAAARQFIDWLADAGFSVWQMLPLGPVGSDGSPYWSRGDGAINPALIDTAEADMDAQDSESFASFCREQSEWLEDYALFEVIAAGQDGASWWQWPPSLRDRDPGALDAVRNACAAALAAVRIQQWHAATQWHRLRAHARARDVRLFGDVHIYVAPDSATVWAERNQFQLRADGQPDAVAGVPPDYFSADGQRWGNPLYDWSQAQRDGFAFWRRRLRRALQQFDLVRIDHFRGLCAYWSVPADAPTARSGHWQPAPGGELMTALAAEFPDLPLVAEDLGVITPDVDQLRHTWKLPGMRVLQFGFDGSGRNPHLPHNYGRDTVAYSGTHDNDTTLGWYRGLNAAARAHVDDYLGSRPRTMPRSLLRALLNSVAALAVVPLQDVLQQGSSARFNTPGTVAGNWRWRFANGVLTPGLAAEWRALSRQSGRCDWA